MNNQKNASNTELQILKEYKASADNMLSLSRLYEQRLLDAFPTERDPNCEYFYPNTFEGNDEIDYFVCREIFDDKDWNQIDLDVLYAKYVQFLMLNPEGTIYYLPAFLKYFYSLKHQGLLFFDYFVGDLVDGLAVPKIDEHEEIWLAKKNGTYCGNYSAFDRLTPIQSKLVAIFLVNVANLHGSNEAQRALTNYWGNFLLF
jgi:hypothetical protein